MHDGKDNQAQPDIDEPSKGKGAKLTSEGMKAIQGNERYSENETTIPEALGDQGIPNPAQKGSDFENWARKELFNGDAKRVTVYPEDNKHLDDLGDDVGITKNRRITDAYWTDDGSLWELKSGYEKGGIDKDQLYEYSLMEQAGYVNARVGNKKENLPVKSINYLFATEAGARANQSGEATFWYVDKQGKVKLLG